MLVLRYAHARIPLNRHDRWYHGNPAANEAGCARLRLQGSIIKKAGFGAGSTERPTLIFVSNKLPDWELGPF